MNALELVLTIRRIDDARPDTAAQGHDIAHGGLIGWKTGKERQQLICRQSDRVGGASIWKQKDAKWDEEEACRNRQIEAIQWPAEGGISTPPVMSHRQVKHTPVIR